MMTAYQLSPWLTAVQPGTLRWIRFGYPTGKAILRTARIHFFQTLLTIALNKNFGHRLQIYTSVQQQLKDKVPLSSCLGSCPSSAIQYNPGPSWEWVWLISSQEAAGKAFTLPSGWNPPKHTAEQLDHISGDVIIGPRVLSV